ncbi:MAG: sulfatase [Wenzhouxiangellaceae bacterium]
MIHWPLSLLVAAMFAAGCTPDPDVAAGAPNDAGSADNRPHIVFITSDDHSVPDLGVYGNPVITTPNIDRLAGQGILFNRAYATTPQCSPSRASLVTGRSATATGNSRLHSPLRTEHANIIEALNRAGYFTAAFRKIHLGEEVEGQFAFRESDESVGFEAAFEQWDGEQPMFLHIGFNEPHRPYEAGYWDPPHDPDKVIVPDYLPDTPEVRQDLALYYDEIAEMDRQIGELMALLEDQGIADNTFVIFVGDNGLPFPGAKGTLYEPGVHVPLFAFWPDRIPAGQVTDEIVSLVDLVPTVLEAAAIEPFAGIEGRSLLEMMRETTGPGVREYAFSERNWHDNLDLSRAVHGTRYKLIRNYLHDRPYRPTMDIQNSLSWSSIVELHERGELGEMHTARYFADQRPPYELFDLQSDPHERINLADSEEHAEIREQLEAVLTEWMRGINDPLPPPHGELPAAAIKALQEQGVDPRDLFR